MKILVFFDEEIMFFQICVFNGIRIALSIWHFFSSGNQANQYVFELTSNENFGVEEAPVFNLYGGL